MKNRDSLTIPEAITSEVGVCKQLSGEVFLVHPHGRGQDKSAHCPKSY